MKNFIEKLKRKITCDPEIDKDCQCKDHMESEINGNKLHYTNKRVCERKID